VIEKSKDAVAIIGGADGPTSVFLVGKSGKRPLKTRIRNYIYQYKRKKVEKKIVAGAHTIKEVVAYARTKYHAMEVDNESRKYVEECKYLKENLIIKHKAELLGDLKEIKKPNVYDEESIRELQRQIEVRSERIAQIPDHEIAMDFHLYEIKIGDGCMDIVIDYNWEVFRISYSGSRKSVKLLEKVAKDLSLYYGVSEEDIRNRSERYSLLLASLSV